MEFLSTYAWAFLVLTLVLATSFLIFVSPGSQTTYAPSSCYITTTLPCYQSLLLENASGEKFVVLFQNNIGAAISFTHNAITFTPPESGAGYVGTCLPQTAPPGAMVTCNVSIGASSYRPQVGSQASPTFALDYAICPACAAGSQSYTTSGESTLTVSSYGAALYTVRLLTSTGTGNIVVSGVKYPSGANVVFIAGVNYPISAVPPRGIMGSLTSWLVSNLTVANYQSQSTTAQGAVNPDPPACLQAAFNSLYYQLIMTESPGTGGTLTPLTGGYEEPQGTVVTISETPNTGYSFAGWTGTGTGSYTGSSASAQITIGSAITETAAFNLLPETLTVTNGGGCTSVSGGGTYNYGSAATFSAVDPTGYTLSWTCTGIGCYAGPNGSGQVTMDSAITETATCAINSYSVSASASPAAGGVVSGGGAYNYGSTATVSETPNTGYPFTGWSCSGSASSACPSGTGTTSFGFTVTGPASVTANYGIPSCTSGGGLTGTITTYGNALVTNHVCTFTGTGTWNWAAPTGVTSVSILVVGGGGDGGIGSVGSRCSTNGESEYYSGNGGNGGSVNYQASVPVTPGTQYTVVVGAGDSASEFTSSYVASAGSVGGSGGNNGAGANGGSGFNGYLSSIAGSPVYYAGGGAGPDSAGSYAAYCCGNGGIDTFGVAGGTGGGGGEYVANQWYAGFGEYEGCPICGYSASANTGGGGGAGSAGGCNGAGGSGLVIVSYATPS
jgi:hypothetical protein